MRKSNEELKKLIEDILAPEFKVLNVMGVNHKPHPYTVGAKHVNHAAKHCGGRLGDETLKVVPCAVPGCQLSYEQHVFDKVAMIQLTRNLTQKEAQNKLKLVIDAIGVKAIDGFTFVETPEKYRID